MTEALAVTVPDIEPVEESRTGTKVKLATAVGLGALGLFGFYAEKHGIIPNNWPPPMRSFKHPWIGYYTAWASDKVFKRAKRTAALVNGQLANTGAKLAQSAVLHNGNIFHWTAPSFEANLDNIADYAVCLGATALYFAQAQGLSASVRYNASRLFGRFSPRSAEES